MTKPSVGQLSAETISLTMHTANAVAALLQNDPVSSEVREELLWNIQTFTARLGIAIGNLNDEGLDVLSTTMPHAFSQDAIDRIKAANAQEQQEPEDVTEM